ncbi:speckle-type POZ protein-like [Cotesia glomerata]|uniref:speckle-type POZ protein-like n=1 Tax=Cotesia glomerata TaxID=32391 RepID=UPI001D01CD64|nr:speckle-type POZ protein-like [Cotesia glomerata]
METGYKFVKKNTIEFEWKITEVSNRMKKAGNSIVYLESPTFTTGSRIGDKWRIRLHLVNSGKLGSIPDMTIYLSNAHHDSVTVHAAFYILNNQQQKHFLFEYEFMMPKNFSFARAIKREKLSNYELELLVNDSLTIHTEITVNDDARTIPIKDFCSSNFANQLANDLEHFYQSKINTDVTFIVGDKKFQAHKIILSSRSPVLAAMFTHDMIEKKTSRVSVEDITSEIFEKFLNYMYTDRVANLDDVALDLLKTADMYQIQSLKDICESSLIKSFKLKNFFEIVDLADRYRAETLKEHAIKYVVDGKRDVINTDEFKQLEKNNPSLALELLKRVVIQNTSRVSTCSIIDTFHILIAGAIILKLIR